MHYTKLGNSQLNIRRICLGTMTWGSQNTQAEGFEQMSYALENGVNFWDTAELYAVPPSPATYGASEKIIGNWFKENGHREDVVLATKFSAIPWARGEEKPTTNRQNLITAVDESLKRLQTDYIDLYQLHWPTNRSHYHFSNWWNFKPAMGADAKKAIIDNKTEILSTLNDIMQQGKIRNIGLSDDSSWGIQQFLNIAEKNNFPRISSIQNEYNLMRRRDEHDVAETCALENVAYLPWSPLAMGVLSGKYSQGLTPDEARLSDASMKDDPTRYAYRLDLNTHNAANAYVAVAKKHGLDPCQMAIAFTLHQPWVTSTIIGATNMDQLKNNINAVDLKLSEECLKDIHTIYQQYPVPF